MKKIRLWSKLLLWLHLFVCLVWLSMFSPSQEPPGWMGHVIALSILGIQFTWGFTVGLMVGPSRKRRPLLWWSLLTCFLPLWVYGGIAQMIGWIFGLLPALFYLAVFIIIVACETYGGVLLGVKVHSEHQNE